MVFITVPSIVFRCYKNCIRKGELDFRYFVINECGYITVGGSDLGIDTVDGFGVTSN